MKIAIATTLHLGAATNIGRMVPLAVELAKTHTVHLLHVVPDKHSTLAFTPPPTPNIQLHSVGYEPFVRTAHGKRSLKNLHLFTRLFTIASRTAATLQRLQPDIVIIAKPHPHNTLGVKWWQKLHRSPKIFLDADDFELTANHTTSPLQRAALHWAERRAAHLSHRIITASPFLADHFTQLTANQKTVTVIPTGLWPITIEQLATLEPPAPAPHLLYIGSLSIRSGHRVDLLPDIFAAIRQEIPAATLTIAGTGDDEAALKKVFQERQLDKALTWTGTFSPSQLVSLLTPTSLLLDPIDSSITQRSKSSFRVLVAGAAGRGIITSNIGIRPQLLPRSLHARFFAEPSNAVSYAELALALLQNPLTKNEQRALKNHAEQFSWTNLAKQYITLLTT